MHNNLSLVQSSESIELGYADDVFGLAVAAKVRASANYPKRLNLPGSADLYVPMLDEQYLFRRDLVQVLQPWFWGKHGCSNILLTGETGTGKTSLIEQASSRLNWPVFRVGCHGSLEFQELVGRVTLNPDGSTGWADGPLILAMKLGGILLLDELNMLPNSAAGGLNTALDGGLNSALGGSNLIQATQKFASGVKGRGAYCVPETGEMVFCHPCFRIAGTGNALDGGSKSKYRGVQTPNIALLDRFTLGIRMQYISQADEVSMLMARYPTANQSIVLSLCEAAMGIRASFAKGTISSVMSTRVLTAVIARMLENGTSIGEQLGTLSRALEMSLLYRVENVDSLGIKVGVLNQLKLNLGASLPGTYKL